MGKGDEVWKVQRGSRETVIGCQHGFVQTLSGLGTAYRGSPIVEGEGKRYFDDSLRGGKGIGSRFLLLLDDDADSSVKEAGSHLAGSYDDIVELRFSQCEGMTLVRPDGYIAHSAPNHNAMKALNSVRSVLERQTKLGSLAPADQKNLC
jgi:hypothetical protein